MKKFKNSICISNGLIYISLIVMVLLMLPAAIACADGGDQDNEEIRLLREGIKQMRKQDETIQSCG